MAARDDEHTIRLAFTGDFRLTTCGNAVRRLRAAIEEIPDRLVVDLGRVTAIDPVAISILLAGYLAASDAGIRFQVVNAQPPVLRRLAVAGVARLLADSDDTGALIAALTHRPYSPHAPWPVARHPHGPGSAAAGPPRRHRLTSQPPHRARVALRCR